MRGIKSEPSLTGERIVKLWIKILIGLGMGILVGALLGEQASHLKPLGSLFLNLINMVIVPLIFSSMVAGITAIHDPQKLGRVGGKTVGIYLLTTLLSIAIALFVAQTFQVGTGLGLAPIAQREVHPPTFADIVSTLVPTNPVSAMAEGAILQVIVFAAAIGIAINLAGEKGKPLHHLIQSVADVMYRLISLIMELAPLGVFGLMAWVVGTFGLVLLIPLLKFLTLYYAACTFHFLIVYGGLLRVIGKLSVICFLKGMTDAIIMAFSTCSSAATLPIAMQCVQEKLGVSRHIAGFILPLGITLNMNGGAIYQAMSAVFVATAYGISLDFTAYMTLTLTTIFASIGTAGIPGSGLIMLSAVLTSVGLPLEGLALLAGIDRLRDMMTTVLNILGDAAVTVFVAKQEGELDTRQYRHSVA